MNTIRRIFLISILVIIFILLVIVRGVFIEKKHKTQNVDIVPTNNKSLDIGSFRVFKGWNNVYNVYYDITKQKPIIDDGVVRFVNIENYDAQ